MAARNVKLTISYDGTAYHGWQVQPDRPTVQQRLTEAVEKLCGTTVRIFGTSRTDAGVHARGQVVNMVIDTPVPTSHFVKALNNLLPDDIAILEAYDAHPKFSAINSAVKKHYRYTICTAPVRPVFDIRFCWHRPGELNVEAMQEAAAHLLGTHDFKSFATASDHREDSVRTLFRCDVTQNEEFIHIDVEGDRFLYNMVRNIVGTLVEIGRGRWTPDVIPDILTACDRAEAGIIAPPAGLCLVQVEMDPKYSKPYQKKKKKRKDTKDGVETP